MSNRTSTPRGGRIYKSDGTVAYEGDAIAAIQALITTGTLGEAKLLSGSVATLADGQAATYDARGCARLTVITGAGAVATVSCVDAADADEHTTGSENQFSVPANTRTTVDVDWPFYRVSVAGGACRVASV